jgi:hypothetical protein
MNNIFEIPRKKNKRIIIEPIGVVYEPNQDGYIVNELSIGNLTEESSHIINFFVNMSTKFFVNNLHSIYVTGSTLTNLNYTTSENIRKNRNFIVVLNHSAYKSRMLTFLPDLIKKSEFQFDVPIIYESELFDVDNFPEFQQFFSACVYGSNIATNQYCFNDVKLDKNKQYYDDVHDALRFYSDINSYDPRNRKTFTQYYCKKILRYGMLKAAHHVGKYSRDLYYCYKFYEQAFPSHKGAMYDVLNLYLNPQDYKPDVFKVAIDLL